MDGTEEGAGVWMVGVAQPIHPATKDPKYDGTMLQELDRIVFANTVSTGMNKLPMVIDHAGLTEYGQLPPQDKIIGYAQEAWNDPELGLMIAAHIPAETSLYHKGDLAEEAYVITRGAVELPEIGVTLGVTAVILLTTRSEPATPGSGTEAPAAAKPQSQCCRPLNAVWPSVPQMSGARNAPTLMPT